jgi:pectate lyase
VAGNIQLFSGLRVTGSNITIDGCSAPGSGINLIGNALEMRGNVDRVSCANAGDGCIDIGAWNGKGTHDVTVQRSILSQPQKNMLIKYVPVHRISIHHNLFEGSSDRNPRVSYDTGGSISPEIIADLRNNVIANWGGGLGTNVERGAKANIVGNYFTNPGASKSNQQQGIVVSNDGSAAYVQGNLSGDVPNIDNSPFIDVPRETVPFAYEPITEEDACSAAHLVLQQAGHPIRDALDTAIVARVSINC